MHEATLLGMSTQKRMNALVNIDFRDAELGSTEIVDRGSLGAKYTRSRISGTSGDGVVEVPGKGRGYYFDGLTSFTSDIIPVIYDREFRLTVEVMATAKAGAVVATGGYPDVYGLKSGYALHFGQYPDNYAQYFMVANASAYQRILLGGPIPSGSIDKIIVSRAHDGSMRIEAPNRGNRNDYPTPPMLNVESYFMIGASHSLDTFQGHLFSLKLEV